MRLSELKCLFDRLSHCLCI